MPANASQTPAPEAAQNTVVQQNASQAAKVDVVISDNGMEAALANYQPAQGDGAPLSLETLQELARRAGVRVDLDPEAVAQFEAVLEKGGSPDGIVIARGTAATPPGDGSIEYKGDPSLPYFPGDIIGKLLPPTPGVPGQTVDGYPVEPPEVEVRDVTALENGGVNINSTGESVAQRHGLVKLENAQVSITPVIKVPDNKLTAVAKVFATDAFGAAPTVGRYKEALRAQGIKVKPDLEALGAAVSKAMAEGKPQEEVVVAKCEDPKDGRDGYFEPFFDQMGSGAIDDSGNIDFSERGAAQTVEAGTKLGRIHPPGRGTPGRDVLGQMLACRDGEQCQMQIGENVELEADGQTCVAMEPGVIVNTPWNLAVTDLYQVDTDLDYSVGNLRLSKGSVNIKGSVREGFTIISPGNVWVGETVEGATIESEADVIVKGGLSMNDKGRIIADGSVSARFALHAVVEAKGDVVIGGSITDSFIMAHGRIICTKEKGLIQGGELHCAKGLECNEIGSDLGVATKIIVGVDLKQDEELNRELKAVREKAAQIEAALGTGSPQEILKRTPPAKQAAARALISALGQIRNRIQELKAKQEENLERAKLECAKATVKVTKAIHPGTTITMAGRTMTIKERLSYAKLRFDPERGQIQAETCS